MSKRTRIDNPANRYKWCTIVRDQQYKKVEMRAEGIERLKQALKWLKCGRKTLGLYFRTKDREWRWNMDYRKKNWCGKNEKSCGAQNEDQS